MFWSQELAVVGLLHGCSDVESFVGIAVGGCSVDVVLLLAQGLCQGLEAVVGRRAREAGQHVLQGGLREDGSGGSCWCAGCLCCFWAVGQVGDLGLPLLELDGLS